MDARQGKVWAIAASAAAFLVPASGQAEDLSACGENMFVRAEATCEFVPPAMCDVMCTPVTVEAACAADLSIACEGDCRVSAQASCNVECGGTCQAKCNVDPGKFDCSAQCRGSCETDCSASCTGSSDVHCAASCKASCTGSCNASCDIDKPSLDCKARCDASCSGSCTAKANASCQVDCQAKGYAKCEVDVTGGCKAECRKNPNGGLFCDGQFVKSDNVDQCVAALRGLLDVNVQGYADSSSSCDGGVCTSTSEAGASCSVSAPGSAGGAPYVFFAILSALGFAAYRRRER